MTVALGALDVGPAFLLEPGQLLAERRALETIVVGRFGSGIGAACSAVIGASEPNTSNSSMRGWARMESRIASRKIAVRTGVKENRR